MEINFDNLIKYEYSIARRAYNETAITDFQSKGEVIEQHKALSKFLRAIRKMNLTDLTNLIS